MRVLIVAQSGMNCRDMSVIPQEGPAFSRNLPSSIPWKAPRVSWKFWFPMSIAEVMVFT